jgi:hypothetical protein
MKTPGAIIFLPVLLLLGLSAPTVHADGGAILARESQGPFVVTIFTTPSPARGSTVDVSVLAQDRDSSDAILDATVDLILSPPPSPALKPDDPICGAMGEAFVGRMSGEEPKSISVAATRAQASNKLLYAAPVHFDASGDWKLNAVIKRGNESTKISCDLPVGPAPRGWIAVLPYLVLTPLFAALFALNQWLRRRPETSY